MGNGRLTERNAAIAEMLSDGEKIKDFYRFISQNPHINLHDACQIIVSRPDATVCFSFNEWNAMDRRITKGRSGIAYYDYDGYKQFVYDATDTHGDSRYQRPTLPMKRLLMGLDELNGTSLYEDERSDWRKIKGGVQSYLRSQSGLSGDDLRNNLLIDGVAYSLYSKTGFPKSAGINLSGLPYSYKENAEFVKEVYVQTDLLVQEIEDAYFRKINEVKVIDDTEEETVSDEPVISSAPVEEKTQTEFVGQTEEQPQVTPYYQKYLDAQKLQPQAVVVMRLGDFYEILGENAKVIAEELDLTLTGRDVGLDERIPMCGMPYHAMDRYLDKILRSHSVLLAEGEEEPKYILSYSEVLGQNEEKPSGTDEISDDTDELSELEELYAASLGNASEQPVKPAQLIAIDVDEPNPFDGERLSDQEEKAEETPPQDVETEETAATEQEQPSISEKIKSTPKKGEKGIKDRKRKPKPQLTLFDIYAPKERSQQEEMIERQLKLGSRVAQGKFRIFDKYNENPTVKAFAEFLKKEYGTGGFSHGTDRQDHDGKGIKMTLYAEGNRKTEEVFLKWNEVAIRTADIIDDDNYFSEQEKKEYVEYRAEQSRIKALRKEEERQKNEFVAKVLCLAPAERKKQIQDGFDKTQSVEEFTGFIQNLHGYQTVDEGEDFRVLYNPIGIFISKYDEKGNRDKGYSLHWEELAVILSKLIGDDKYLSTSEEQPFNPFKELSATGRAVFNRYQQKPFSDPYTSPWGKVQNCAVIANGIYSVSTEGHGGMLIAGGLAPYILSPKALEKGYLEDGYYYYEEDCDENIPLRELYDKGILNGANDYFTHYYVPSDSPEAKNGKVLYSLATETEKTAYLERWNKTINESLSQWHPDYWQAHEQTGTAGDIENEPPQINEEDKPKEFIAIGDRYIYKKKEVTVKKLNGLHPNEIVIEYEQQSGELSYTVIKNVDRDDFITNSIRADDRTENTDLNGVLDQSEPGGQKSRFQGNVAAIKLANRLYAENRNPTEEERNVLAQFVGWGGLPQAFDENNAQWKKEYNELKALLSSEDYEQAKGSTLNAYYTPKEVIDGIYAALERFGVNGNNRILEPSMGTGNFFGYMPKGIADGSRLYGVELDNLTGRIAAKLYPRANVQIKGFEDTTFPDGKFDIIVGNVPFGGYGIADSDYNRYNFKVHDYFLAKSIDKVKPNGIVAIVTSKGTMDKLNPSARKYVAERAELLGAIRLPNTAFKQTAGTEAVADVLFFRKYTDRINVDAENTEWLSTGKTEEGYEVNQYFINHPEMVLGTLVEEVGLYGLKDVTVKPDGRELSAALETAVKNLPQNFYESPETPPEEDRYSKTDYNVKPLCYKADGGRLYMRIGEKMVEQAIPQTPKDAYQRIKSMIALREELRHILDIQIHGCSDEVLKEEQGNLNAQYDLFVRKYGNLNSQINTRLFRDDGDSALLFACEDIDKDTGAISKAEVFTKRTIRPYIVPTSTDDPFEALQISKNERGYVDICYIEELTGKDYDTVISELGDAVFRDPEKTDRDDKFSGFVTSEEYLSGKVVEKLNIARMAAQEYPEYQRNVAALTEVQPTPLKASEISVRLGASWVDKEYYKQFYLELIDAPWYCEKEVELFYNPFDSSWRLDQEPRVRTSTRMKQKQVYGTERAPAYRLFIDALNQKTTTIFDTIEEDGKEKRVVNQAETIAAREKQNKIKEEFRNWIFADPERREELESKYNRLFNQIRLPKYDGSYLKFPEMNPAIELHPHQKDAVHRIITGNGSTLLHHIVGSGKTYTSIAAIMKMRQFGLCKKAIVAVPNHLVKQWANDWRKLYPNANILVAAKEDLEKENRKKFVSRVALGDWDGIIIAQSAFTKINISTERQIKKLQEEINRIEQTLKRQWQDKGVPRGAVKNLEKIKKNKNVQLKKLMAGEKKDNVLIFENLGVDYMFVDEAHYYKNLFFFTKMNNVAGISTAASQRATDLKLKCECLQELHDSDRGVVFATGTPISNSMTEMYTMQSYLQPSILKENGINFFDGWAADFGETVNSMELTPSGQGYRARTRFCRFTNLPELQTMYRSFADVITGDMVQLAVPEVERHVINLKPSDTVIELAERIAERAEKIYGGGVDPSIDNMLKVTLDGKKLALDPRCLVPSYADEAGSKLNECAQRVYDIWQETAEQKSTQIVFCDLSTPKKKYEDYIYGIDFDAYNDLKYKLVQKGIPAEEVAFIHDATTDESKQLLFDNINSGKVRVLIGSTEKCGAGMNVQKRLKALHHLDAPYRPSDLEQREGRIIRQGNTNRKVDIYTYVTERTFDSYSYQILENKQRFISQISKGDFTAREFEDSDETTLSYAEIKAITAANPKIKRKMEVDSEIARLRTLEGQYKKNKYGLQDKVRKYYPEEIKKLELLIKRVTADLEHLQSSKSADPESFSISVAGTVYTERKEGGKALLDAFNSSRPETVIAEYCGFKISVAPMISLAGEREMTLAAEGQYTIDIGESASGNLARLDNFIEDFPERKERLENTLQQFKSDMAIAREQYELPFEHTEKLSELLAEQARLNTELNLNKNEDVIIDEENADEDEDNYRALPTQKKEVEIIDEEDKVAAMGVELLPDYTVTQKDMHGYGYTWDGMLPLSRNTALRLWGIGLEIHRLAPNDTDSTVRNYDDFNSEEKAMYGIEKPVWNNYLNNEKSVAYFAARLNLVSAALETAADEMSEVEGGYKDKFLDDCSKERSELENYLAYRKPPQGEYAEPYILPLLDEFSERIWNEELKSYGWTEKDVKAAIAEHISDEEQRARLKQMLKPFNAQKELMTILANKTDGEIEEMDLPALDDELTVLDKVADRPLNARETLSGLLLLQNDEVSEWYVINDTSAKNKDGRPLEVGDKTDVETVLAYNGLQDGNPLRTFYDKVRARMYFNEKAAVTGGLKGGETMQEAKEPDYEKEVIDSVNAEFEAFKAETLKETPEDIFYGNYKIHVFTEFQDVIAAKGEDSYLEPKYYRALYEDRGRILQELYDDFIGEEYASVNSMGDTSEFIESYCERYHKNAMYPAVYYGKDTENTAYYKFTTGLSYDTLPQITQEADSYVIAAPASFLPQKSLKEHNIFFLKTGRNISEDELADDSKAIDNMQKAVHKILSERRREYLDRLNFHIECKGAIETAIRDNYDGMHLTDDFGALFSRYDFEKIKYVLANTVQCLSEDGRISKDNKAWADGSKITENEGNRYQFVLHTHPAVLDGFIDVIRRREKETEVGKRVVYYTVKAMEQGGRRGYTALYADEKSGESGPIYTRTFDTEEEVRSVIAKLNASKDAHRKEYYEYVAPEEFDGLRERIIKATNDRTLQGKFLNETKQGYKVLSLMKDENERNIAVIYRHKVNDYIVAARYDTSRGDWAQGIYVATLEDALQERKERYGDRQIIYENKEVSDLAENNNWIEVYVSKNALIKSYEKSSFMRMPITNEKYRGYTYNIFNNRIKGSRQITDAQSDERELCYKISLRADETVLLKDRDGNEAELTAQEFRHLVNHTADRDYDNEQLGERIRIDLPQESIIKDYDKTTLFMMPSNSKYKGYVYYLPNSVIHEDKEKEDGSFYASIGEDFSVTLHSGDEKIGLKATDFAGIVNGTKAEDYERDLTAFEEYTEQQDEDEKAWETIVINESAVIANYDKSALLKMPKGKYEGLAYYVPNGMLRHNEEGTSLRLPADFEVHLKDGSNTDIVTLTAAELKAEIDGKTDEDYENYYRKPSEEMVKQFEKVEKQLRAKVPEEMRNKPNWVIVRTRENKATGRLDKFLIDVHTGDFAESDNPETWSDFDTACEYAKKNGGVCLAYALDGKDGIACIDLDDCMVENGDFSELANKAFHAAQGSYTEKSVSGKGLHIFGKTKGADLRSFSKDGDMEYYQGGHFIAMTGDCYGSSELRSFDTPEMSRILESKLERRQEWTNTGKGVEGITSMDDREMLEKAFEARNGDMVKRLYNGEDVRHNHSNSDMSLMNYLAFWSGHDISQMLRVFATSGLYRPEKPQSYYEYTAIKAVKGTPMYTPPKASDKASKPSNSGNGKGGK